MRPAPTRPPTAIGGSARNFRVFASVYPLRRRSRASHAEGWASFSSRHTSSIAAAVTAPVRTPIPARPWHRPAATSRRFPSLCCRWSSHRPPRSAVSAATSAYRMRQRGCPCAVLRCARTAARCGGAGRGPARPASAATGTVRRPGCSRAGAGAAHAAAPAPAARTTRVVVRAASAAQAVDLPPDPDGTCSAPAADPRVEVRTSQIVVAHDKHSSHIRNLCR